MCPVGIRVPCRYRDLCRSVGERVAVPAGLRARLAQAAAVSVAVTTAATVALLAGCQVQQTNIVRTTRYPDGTEVHYSNTSSGYGYNPNVTVDVNSNVSTNASVSASGTPAQVIVGGGGVGYSGWGYAGPAVVPVAVPAIAPAFSNCWAPSPWPGPAWIPGTPYFQNCYGVGVSGPPVAGFGFGGYGFGCR
jgi:hypothetical protein